LPPALLRHALVFLHARDLPPATPPPAAFKFVRYEFLFNPKTCYAPKARPCKLLKRNYTQIDTAPKPWAPAALNPGEYLTHIVAVTSANKRVQIVSQLMAVGSR
jgi:hypothetical protein